MFFIKWHGLGDSLNLKHPLFYWSNWCPKVQHREGCHWWLDEMRKESAEEEGEEVGVGCQASPGCRRACAWALASLASSPAACSYSWTCQWTWSDLPPYTFPAPGEEGAVRGYLYNWLEKCNKWEHAKSGGSGWERKWDRAGERRSRKVQVSINKTGIDPVREEWRRK